MTQQRVYLDCDGVLADFDLHFFNQHGMEPAMFEAKYSQRTFWDTIQSKGKFFKELPLMKEAMAIFNTVAHRRPLILTGVPRGNWAEPQKKAWGRKNFPGTPMITCFAKDKSMYCQPGDILVDDRDKYRNLWEEAGGTFIHYKPGGDSLVELAYHT